MIIRIGAIALTFARVVRNEPGSLGRPVPSPKIRAQDEASATAMAMG